MGQRAVIYCRVSTADQSCERQERELLEFSARAGYTVAAIYKETASGSRVDRAERKKALALAQARKVDAILVTELTRWGRSTIDLVQSLQALQGWNVSLIAVNGLTFDLTTPHGKLMASVMAALAEFERDLIRERVKSGIAAAKARGQRIGRQKGQRPTEKLTPKIIELRKQGLSYRKIADRLGISKNTALEIIKRIRLSVD